METVIVATAQQQMRLFESPEEYRREPARFMQIAQAKGASLIIFPALSGILAVSPLLQGFRVGLLRRAGANRRNGSVLHRAHRALAGSTAEMLKANFYRPYRDLLAADPGVADEACLATFSELAQIYAMTVVAGSAYLPSHDGAIRHTAVVFGPDGHELGRQGKVLLSPMEEGWVQPDDGWRVITTPMGRLGVVFGEEITYPEIGRLMAQQEAGLIVALCATNDEAAVAEVRLAAIARAQENLCFVATSFSVGPDYLSSDVEGAHTLLGRSGIYAPQAQTPRHSGALVEMGALSTEGLLTGELNGVVLIAQREEAAPQLRRVAAVVESSGALLVTDDESLPLSSASEAFVEDDSETEDQDEPGLS